MDNITKSKVILARIMYHHPPRNKESRLKLEVGITLGLKRLNGTETKEEEASIILGEINDVYEIFTTRRPILMCEIMNVLDKLKEVEDAH